MSHRSETLIYASSPQLWSVYTPAQRGTPTVCNDIMGHRGAEYLTKVDETKIIHKGREEGGKQRGQKIRLPCRNRWSGR